MELQNRSLAVNQSQLAAIMQAFHTVTGIKSTLYDAGFREILTYPAKPCEFCRLVREKYFSRCMETDRKAFSDCAGCGRPFCYCCHAGLYEVISPLRNGSTIIGYIMFGQMLQQERKEQTMQTILRDFSGLAPRDVLESALRSVVSKSRMEIDAATLLMQTCINYLLFHQIVRVDQGNFVDELDRYIRAHLSDEITVSDLYRYLGMSRSSFYVLARKCLGCGIMEYIRRMKIEKARELLRTTDTSITEISGMVGFLNYNYFLRIFKKETGQSCREYRRRPQK